jgi:hypothetical protein
MKEANKIPQGETGAILMALIKILGFKLMVMHKGGHGKPVESYWRIVKEH